MAASLARKMENLQITVFMKGRGAAERCSHFRDRWRRFSLLSPCSMAENDADPPPPGLQSAGIAVPLLEAAHAAQTGLLREKGWEVDGNFLRVSVPRLKAAVKARRQARQKEARRIAARDRMRANRAAAGKEGRAAEALKRKARRAAAGADGRANEARRRKAHRAAAGAAGKASERERDALRHAKKRVLEHAWRHERRRITDKEELEDRIILWRAKEEG